MREKAVVASQPTPVPSGRKFGIRGRDTLRELRSGGFSPLDETEVLPALKDTITAGHQRLGPILEVIADAARSLTGASGAAIAMWKDGEMVCRARSGEAAPEPGARLNAESGISGECLRTGEIQHCADTDSDVRVDAEVCRRLALRAIAVLPIRGWHSVNGILEVFSTQPHAFTAQHIAVLERLAALAERARALQPYDACPTAKAHAEQAQTAEPLPAPDRVRDVAFAFLNSRWRPFVLGGGSLLGLLLLGFVIWLGWRSPGETNVKTQAAQSPGKGAPARPFDNDAVWKPNPGGELLARGKTSAGTPVKPASKVEVISGQKAAPDRAPVPGDVSTEIIVRHEIPASPAVETSLVEPPPIPATSPSPALNGALSSPVPMPGLSAAAISRGVSKGYLLYRVPPVYPTSALLMRLQGSVVLQGLITEDGTVQDLKVIQGNSVLARAAVDAVQHWRYKPYELNGKPIKMNTTITVSFKLP